MIKSKSLVSVFALFFIVSITGCNLSSSHETNREERQKIVDNFEQQLHDLDLKIHEGEAKLANVAEDARAKLNDDLIVLKQKQAAAKETLSQLKQNIADGTSEAWQKAKDSFEGAWHDITSKAQTWLDAIK